MTTERPDRGARALAERIGQLPTLGAINPTKLADAILANGAVFLPDAAELRTVVRDSSPFRNCQYAGAFRAPCEEVNRNVPESWCAFCQAHARLRAALEPEGSAPDGG